MKITALIEKGLDGIYSVFIAEKSYPYGIIGTGNTVKEARDDFMAGYRN